MIMDAVSELYDKIVNKNFTVRRMYVMANHVVSENRAADNTPEQIDLFTDYEQLEIENKILSREREIQKAVVQIKHKFGKNAILKGRNLENGATTISRNGQVGGHRA